MKKVAIGLCIAVLASGCGQASTMLNSESAITPFDDPSAQTAVPAPTSDTSHSSTPTPTETWTGDEAAAVAAAQRLLSECIPNADKDPMNARKHLAECAADNQLETVAASIGRDLDNGFATKGQSTIQVHEVSKHATGLYDVRVCLDSSQVTRYEKANPTNETAGHANLSRNMVVFNSPEGWRVVGTQTLEGEDFCG